MTPQPSPFIYKGQPSSFSRDPMFVSRQQGGAGMPTKAELAQRNLNASVAAPGKSKQKPGVGASRTI